jgi:hypothetical protein
MVTTTLEDPFPALVGMVLIFFQFNIYSYTIMQLIEIIIIIIRIICSEWIGRCLSCWSKMPHGLIAISGI